MSEHLSELEIILAATSLFSEKNSRFSGALRAPEKPRKNPHLLMILVSLISTPKKRFSEIYRKQNELLKPVLKKIDEAIQKVGSEQEYDFILDAVSGALLYALDSHNLTEDVMDELSKATGSVTE